MPAHAQTSNETVESDPTETNPTQPSPSPTPTPTPTPVTPSPTGNVVISQILWQQTASNDPNILVDEFIEIRNDDSVPIDLTGWTIADAGPFSFTFTSRVIQPGETCRVYSHFPQGANTWPCEETFGRTSPGSAGNYIWNNGGDTATLSDASSTIIDTCSYGSGDANPYSCP